MKAAALVARGKTNCAGKLGIGSKFPRRRLSPFHDVAHAEIRSQSPFFPLDRFCQWLLLLAIAGSLAAPLFAAGENPPRITYIKSFPGSTPAYVEISLERSGATTYKEAADDDPEAFTLNGATTSAIFDLAAKLDHFSHPLESGLKIAKMGEKTLRWEGNGKTSEVKFNYSTNADAQALADWFERITQTERLLLQYQRAIRHDRLGVNDALLGIQSAWDGKRLAGADRLLPLLDKVAASDVYMRMSRERAAQLAAAIRAAEKP